MAIKVIVGRYDDNILKANPMILHGIYHWETWDSGGSWSALH